MPSQVRRRTAARAAVVGARAVERLEAHGAGRSAAAELRQLQAWLTPTLGVVSDWVHAARAMLVDPRRHAASPAPVAGQLLAGYANLVRGELSAAIETSAPLGHDSELGLPAETAAALGGALARTLAGPDVTDSTDSTDGAIAREQAVGAAKLLGAPVVSQFAYGLQAIAAGDRTTIEYLLRDCGRAEDRWGAAILRLFAEVIALAAGSSSPEALESVEVRGGG